MTSKLGNQLDVNDKTFLTEWRLKKHERIHLDKVKTDCIYFKNKVNCPFENLGCKFLQVKLDVKFEPQHAVHNLENIVDKNKDFTFNETREETDESCSFKTSTPKKTVDKCKEFIKLLVA